MTFTREEAIERLRLCPNCGTWRTDPDCDRCWINHHRCPPTVEQAMEAINGGIRLGQEAERLNKTLKALLP